MFVNQSPKQLLRAISSFFSIISNSLNRRSIHNNRLIFLRKCPAASPAILPAVSTGSTFEIVALITKRLPVYRFIASASESCDPAEIQLSPEFFRIPHKPLHTVFVFFPIPSHSDVPSDAAFLIFQGWLADTYFHSSQFRAAPLLLAALSSVGRDPGMGCLCMHQSLSLFLFQKQEDQVSRVRPATKFQELCDNTPCWLCLGKYILYKFHISIHLCHAVTAKDFYLGSA